MQSHAIGVCGLGAPGPNAGAPGPNAGALAPEPDEADGRVRARTAVEIVALTLLVTIAGLTFWSVLPAALGWRADVVLSGSMAPRVLAGDVVVAEPVDGAEVEPGQLVVFDDPARPGETVLHRVVRIQGDGSLVTRGDANAADDSTPVSPEAVRARPRLRIPYIGLPARWLRTGDHLRLGATALALVALGLPFLLDARRERAPDAVEGDAPVSPPPDHSMNHLSDRPLAREGHAMQPDLSSPDQPPVGEDDERSWSMARAVQRVLEAAQATADEIVSEAHESAERGRAEVDASRRELAQQRAALEAERAAQQREHAAALRSIQEAGRRTRDLLEEAARSRQIALEALDETRRFITGHFDLASSAATEAAEVSRARVRELEAALATGLAPVLPAPEVREETSTRPPEARSDGPQPRRRDREASRVTSAPTRSDDALVGSPVGAA